MPQEPTSPRRRRRRRAPSGTPRRLTLVNPQIRVEDPDTDEASPEEVTAPGGSTQAKDHHTTEDYFTAEEREGLAHWRAIVADMPPMTQEEIERVGAIFRRIDARRKAA